MTFDHHHYVPCLRWKQGEYQAILNLSDATKALITPLIEIPEIGFDFEKGTQPKSLDEHLRPFSKRVRDKWKGRTCFVDLRLIESSNRMSDGQHPAELIFDELRSLSCLATPVTGFNRGRQYQHAVRQAALEDKRGICLRLGIEESAEPDLMVSIDALLDDLALKVEECDLIIDLGTPNFEPVEGFAKLIEMIIQRLPHLQRWRTFTLIGTSFPASMGGVERGTTTVRRFEWILYQRISRRLTEGTVRLPAFGDYAINHPDVLLMDMRKVKPSATIRYTATDSWFIVKGTNVRDNGYEQYRQHCQSVIASPHYAGPGFSWGDRYIADCAAGKGRTGNLSTWRKVGTNRHMEKVVSDISSFFGSSGSSGHDFEVG